VRYGVADYLPEGKRREALLTRRGVALDIGGGGARLLITEDIPIGTTLLVEFALPKVMGCPLILGEVVRKMRHQSGAHWIIGLRFINVEQHLQDRIVEFVFKTEIRQQLRKHRYS